MLKILVASSDPELLSAVSRPLAATKDFHVSWAYDGFDVRTMIGETEYAGAIIELSLPGPSLQEVCADIKAKNPKIPILLVADQQEDLSPQTVGELKATDFIKKPIFSVTLLKKVRGMTAEMVDESPALDRTAKTARSDNATNKSPDNDILSRIYKRLERHIDFRRDLKIIERVNMVLARNDNLLTYKDLFAMDIGTAIDMFRMANSTILGAQSKVTGFSTVLQRLGLNGITENFEKLAKKEHKIIPLAQRMIRDNFRYHSLLTACLAEEISALSSRFNHSELYSAGLFHDTGKLFFISYYPQNYHELLSTKPDWKYELKEAENKAFGIDHAELGSLIFRKLGFSRMIQEASVHEKASADKKNSFQNPKSMKIIHTADALSHIILDGDPEIDFEHEFFDDIKDTIAEYRVSMKVIVENSVKRIGMIGKLLNTPVEVSGELTGRLYDTFSLSKLKKKMSPSEMTEKIPSWHTSHN